ncbi:MAG: lipopolysaccharide assembly protein LapA domain-containing protein [Thermodesulfobacteriota bacterium]
MNVKFIFFLAIIALSSFFYLYVENPGDVTVVITATHNYTLPLVLVLFLSFLVGVCMMGLDSVISDTMRSLKAKKARKTARAVEEAKETYRKGLEEMAREDFKGAREHIEKALLCLPGDLSMTLALSETFMREGNAAEAVEALETELFHNPTSVVILTALGKAARSAGENERAARAFEEILKIEKGNHYAIKELRDININEGLWAEAAALEEQLVEGHKKGWFRSSPTDYGKLPGLLYEQASLSFDAGDTDKAEEVLKEALKKDETFIPAQVLLGDIYSKKYGAYEGLVVWEKAYKRSPGNAVLLLRIEDYQIAQSAPEKMMELYNRELEARPDDINLLILRARFYLRVEIIEKAVDELEGLQVRGKDNYYSKLLLATAYSRQGREVQAADLLAKAINLDTRHTSPSFTCSRCSTSFGQWHGRCSFCGQWNTLHMNPEAR